MNAEIEPTGADYRTLIEAEIHALEAWSSFMRDHGYNENEHAVREAARQRVLLYGLLEKAELCAMKS